MAKRDLEVDALKELLAKKVSTELRRAAVRFLEERGLAQGWTAASGVWAVTGGGYRQSGTGSNTNAYRSQTQNQLLVYQWRATFTSGTSAGPYLFASTALGTHRGNSYRIWQDATHVRIYESANNVATLRTSFAAANAAGQTHSYQASYDPLTGKLQVWRDNLFLGSWTDATPLLSGSYLALRTDTANVLFDDLVVSEMVKYYESGGQRVALRKNGAVSYLFGDHLGSTSVTASASGARTGELWYKPWGETRGTPFGTTPTTYRYTGQREDASVGLHFYGARYYDSVLGRFIQADTIVPSPGSPQSLNRYSYVGNRPLRFVDPSGLAECAAGDQQCWTDEWNWKNRWYEAHGYGWSGSHWGQIIDAQFKDAAIFNDVMMEAGINIVWSWSTPSVVTHIGQGIVRFGQALAGGLPHLKQLLGGGATIKKGDLRGSPYAPPWFNNTVYIPESNNAQWLRQTVVHELAHVIDWHNNFSGAWAKQNGALTEYAAGFHPYPAIWEVWAEAVKVWVFGSKDQNSGAWSSSISLRSGMDPYLTVQMDRLTALLGGSR